MYTCYGTWCTCNIECKMAMYKNNSCLCRSVFSIVSSKNKKKLFHGANALVKLPVLKSILKRKNPVMALTVIPKPCYRNAYLCTACQTNLLICKKLLGE